MESNETNTGFDFEPFSVHVFQFSPHSSCTDEEDGGVVLRVPAVGYGDSKCWMNRDETSLSFTELTHARMSLESDQETLYGLPKMSCFNLQ